LDVEGDTEDDEGDAEDDEDSGGGWFDNVVDSGGDIVGDATDVVVDGAGEVWDGAQQAPGAIWNGIEQAPGAAGDAVTGTWQSLREFFSNRVELHVWAEFLEDHPLLRIVLGPLVRIITGLSPDGTISYLEIGLGVLTLLIPAVKAGPALWSGIGKMLPWSSDAENVLATVRLNPGGIATGMMDMFRYFSARTIVPRAEDIATLPQSPGVYIALDETGTPIYVGMSNSLQRRVQQHFTGQQSVFAPRTDTIKIIQTDSVADARALECRLIKQFEPKDNVIYRGPGACPTFTGIPIPLAHVQPGSRHSGLAPIEV